MLLKHTDAVMIVNALSVIRNEFAVLSGNDLHDAAELSFLW